MSIISTKLGNVLRARGAGFDPRSDIPASDTQAAIEYLRATIAGLSTVYQPLDSDLTAIAALTTTSYGRALLALADGTALAALVDSFFLTPAEGNAAYQPLDADLTAIAALATTTFGRAFLTMASAAATRSVIGLDTADSPTFAGITSTGQVVWSGDISPTQLAANTNDWAPTGLSTAAVIRFSTDASRDITGLTGGADGRVLLLHNIGAQNAVLKDESGSSTAANRFALNADVTLVADESTILQYDSTSSRWRAIGSPIAGLTPAGRALLDDANAAAQRTTLGLGAVAVETYATGTWTPTFTFATPGDLAVTYAAQSGTYTRIGRFVECTFSAVSSAFTHTTASGAALISGVPFTPDSTSSPHFIGSMIVGGITSATHTQWVLRARSTFPGQFEILAQGSGVGSANVVTTHIPTGGTINFRGTVLFEV